MAQPPCITLASMERDEGEPSRQMRGQDLNLEFRRFNGGEQHVEPSSPMEEVGAVISGRFEIRTDEESYALEAGEGIMIPPFTETTWRCVEGPGVVYRVRTAGARS